MEQPRHHRERLRFEDISYDSFPDGSTRVRVRLEWEGTLHIGEAHGSGTLEGDLRASAEATLKAASTATVRRVRLTLIGIKAVRAFDARVIIAAVDARIEELQYKLIGAHAVTEGDLPRAAVLTILDAVNRVVGPLVVSGEHPSDEAGAAVGGEAGEA